MTKEYSAAIDAHNVAAHKFYAVRDAYRARTASDAEFLAARAEFDAATALFDAAFDKESANATD
jgi:hypothetical protein